MTNRVTIRVTILATVLWAPMMFTGCTASEADDLEFRGASGQDLSYPGNEDIEIRAGSSSDDDDVDIPDTILWDLAGGNVTRQAEPGVYAERLVIEGNQILGSNGYVGQTVLCTALDTGHASGEVYALTDAGDHTVLTLWKDLVFVGQIDDPHIDSPQLAFSFEGQEIYAGRPSDGEAVAHASEKIDRAEPMRRLLLGALVTGECGSDGLP
ncbi:MAG: hypothetical protein AAGF11_09835 [Myxococcota bacterium]